MLRTEQWPAAGEVIILQIRDTSSEERVSLALI